jgi:hypothetical protein
LVAPAVLIEKRLILTTEAGKKTREVVSKPARGNQWRKGSWKGIPMQPLGTPAKFIPRLIEYAGGY